VLPVSVVDEAIVNGVAGVMGREGHEGLAGHAASWLLKMESDELAVKAVEAEVTEMSLKAGEMAPFLRLSTLTWTIRSRTGASGVLVERMSCLRLLMDEVKAGRVDVTAGNAAARFQLGDGDSGDGVGS